MSLCTLLVVLLTGVVVLQNHARIWQGIQWLSDKIRSRGQ